MTYLSIVTTLYRSAPYLEQFYQRVCAAAETLTTDFELIMVNDGSPDQSLEMVINFHQNDRRVRVIDLSRNFGHHKAMMTGLSHAHGELVFLIDCDLEIAPETLITFYETFQSADLDVVFGVQEQRQDRLFDRLAGQAFYLLFNYFSTHPLPYNLTTVRLMSYRYVQALVAHQEREILIGGLWVITGFKQMSLPVVKASKGSTTYTLQRRLAIIVNAITSFSNKPLIFIFYLGLVIIFGASIAALYLIVQALISGFLAGWPSLIVSVWLLGGLTIFCIGILGIYLAKIFSEVKQRPYTIIRHLYDHTQEVVDEVPSDSRERRSVLQ
jgi:putative glycosyltransferase